MRSIDCYTLGLMSRYQYWDRDSMPIASRHAPVSHTPMPADGTFYVGLLCDVCVCIYPYTRYIIELVNISV